MRCKLNVISTENFSQRRLPACWLADEELIFLAIKYLLHRGRGGGWKSSDKLLQYNPQIFPLINVIELPPRSA